MQENKKNSQSGYKKLLLAFLLLIFSLPGQSQRTDTLYFTGSWFICEKPFAKYYRFGKIVIDSFWYYTGVITDYYMDGTLQMDGTYSADGFKEGQFRFFYPDGKINAAGRYTNNMKTGVWDYYHPNGRLHYRIRYEGDGINFVMLDFMDSTGTVQTRDSTGSFELVILDRFTTTRYRLNGQFTNGQRDGTWNYYYYDQVAEKRPAFIEEYDKGIFKKGKMLLLFDEGYKTSKKDQVLFRLPEFLKFNMSEAFKKEPLCFPNKDDDQDLADYLIKRESPSFSTEGESFEESYFKAVSALNKPSITGFFSDPSKDYDGVITFNLSDSGDVKEVEISGNLSPKEKEYMEYFIRKIKNVHELTFENISIDAYHKIYFFTIDFQKLFKGYLKNIDPLKLFMFSPIPYDKLQEDVIRNLKKKKKDRN